MALIPTPEDINKNRTVQKSQEPLILKILAKVPGWQELWEQERLADNPDSSVLELAGESTNND